MPDLKRVCLAAAAVTLLAAIAGGQQSGPFPKPPRMPPEIAPGNGAPWAPPPPGFSVELDNSQIRVIRYKLNPHQRWTLPDASSAGQLLIAITDVYIATPSGPIQISAGETRWVSAARPWVSNTSARECEFLLIQPKRN